MGLALFLTGAVAPAGLQADAATEAPVAVIGSDTIGSGEYLAYLRTYVRSKLYHGGSPERLRQLAGEALENLVADRLLLQEAERRGISGDEAAVAKQIEALRAQYKGSETWPQVEPQLPAIAEKLRADSRIAALRAEVTKVAAPTEAELQAFHAANLELFTQPAAWDLGLILIGVSPSALTPEWDAAAAAAGEVAATIRAGEPFDAAAAEHSTHASSAEGGQLGRVHAGQLPGDAQDAIQNLAPGEITDPIRVLEGVAIFRLNERIPSRVHPLNAVRERANALYLRNTGSDRWSALLAGLRAEVRVETFDLSGIVEQFMAGE